MNSLVKNNLHKTKFETKMITLPISHRWIRTHTDQWEFFDQNIQGFNNLVFRNIQINLLAIKFWLRLQDLVTDDVKGDFKQLWNPRKDKDVVHCYCGILCFPTSDSVITIYEYCRFWDLLMKDAVIKKHHHFITQINLNLHVPTSFQAHLHH